MRLSVFGFQTAILIVMANQAHIDAVKSFFAAFARNDSAAALSMLAEDVDWQNFGPAELL
jgi:ketosteroid isomerase-like protein